MSKPFFDDLGDALRGFLPKELRSFSSQTSSRNIKVWYGEENAEHYEVQFVSVRRSRRILEVGFHAEHRSREDNDEAIDSVRAAAKHLGSDAEATTFLGRPSPWMRLSETWDGDGLDAPETAIEAAERLAAYIRAIEPLRVRARGRSQAGSPSTRRRP